MELFLSTYVNKVDRKGRVSVPATFRSALATHRQPNLVIAFPSFRLPALECTGSDRMEEMQDRIESLEEFSEEHENLSQLFADAHPLTIDGEGRVVLSDAHKSHAGITEAVAFVGLGHKFRIWEPGRFRAELVEATDKVRAFKHELGTRVAAPKPLGARE